MSKLIARFVNDNSGATAIEYGLIAALVSISCIVALGLLGDELVKTFESITTGLQGE